MEPEEQIKRARVLRDRIKQASAQVGPRDRMLQVKGADPNELKKIYAFFLKHRDMNELRKLVGKLPSSNFARRSGSTHGYYQNIQTALSADFYRLNVDDAVFVLGWACRLM